jgi:ABC-type uncharacterized transport system involved in gliding motility auxiliary subunit
MDSLIARSLTLKTNNMANTRKLKKEIDLQIYELISDCFTYREVHPENKAEEISAIITDAVNLRNDLIHRVNHPVANESARQVHLHYQNIKKDLVSQAGILFERLSSVSKKKKK